MRTPSLLFLALVAAPAFTAELVSPFAGSEEQASYDSEFDRFQYAKNVGSGIEKVTIEGRLSSRIFTKPEEKSSYEVYKSYQKELEAAGFEMLAMLGEKKGEAQKLGREINKGAGVNTITDRAYKKDGRNAGGGNANWLATFTEYYISARKIDGGTEYVVVVLIADRKNLYSVDVLASAAMEQHTVSLSLDAMRSEMASKGRVAVYGILFDTGSAAMRPDSGSALEVIAQYLNENPQQSFYVVGHTDDAGNLASNIKLSQARAESTVSAIVGRVPGSKSRLTAHGVGPLSPVSTNAQEDGRQLNRRVELVSSID